MIPVSARRSLILTLLGALFVGVFPSSGSVAAQKRDYLTEPESDLVRFHQELDKRMEIFIRAIDRRFAVINGVKAPTTKKIVKDEPEWGEAPKGTRTELLGDISGILDAAIDNIDDVSRRDEKNPLISRSLRKLTSSANAYATQLTALRNHATDPDELAVMDRIADNLQQILEAGNKLPAATEADKKKKKP